MEDILRDDLEHADIIMYPASPTISIPATYPMLDPEPEEIEKDPGTWNHKSIPMNMHFEINNNFSSVPNS